MSKWDEVQSIEFVNSIFTYKQKTQKKTQKLSFSATSLLFCFTSQINRKLLRNRPVTGWLKCRALEFDLVENSWFSKRKVTTILLEGPSHVFTQSNWDELDERSNFASQPQTLQLPFSLVGCDFHLWVFPGHGESGESGE